MIKDILIIFFLLLYKKLILDFIQRSKRIAYINTYLIDLINSANLSQNRDLIFFNKHITTQAVKQVVHRWLVTRQRVIVIKSIDLDLFQIELVASKHAFGIHILRQFLCYKITTMKINPRSLKRKRCWAPNLLLDLGMYFKYFYLKQYL